MHNLIRAVETTLDTKYGRFFVIGYEDRTDPAVHFEHIALVMGDVSNNAEPVIVRVHSKCLTGEVFKSLRCDCAQQLEHAFELISRVGRGVVVYLDQEGRGIGLINKLKAYNLQTTLGFDTVSANHYLGFPTDLRDFGPAAYILHDVGVDNIHLLSNNPNKAQCLKESGILVKLMPMLVEVSPEAQNYLQIKVEKLGHIDPKSMEGTF